MGVLGGVIVDETDTDGGNELVINGNGTLRYSWAAMQMIEPMLPPRTLVSVDVIGWRQVNN